MSLELKNINKRYKSKNGDIDVLNNINLTFKEGSFVCILGTSGCGKTTLLNIIAGFEKQSSGNIFFDNRKIEDISTERIMMFQESALFPWLNVEDNVEFGMKMLGVNKKERKEKALSYLSMVNLTKFRDSYIHELSGGMKQRVALARALSMNSEILLMDEPFAALDAHNKSLLHLELLNIWKDSGKTIVFVTHDVKEAVMLSDTIVIISSDLGNVKQIIEIEENRENRMFNENLCRLVDNITAELGEGVKKSAED